MQCYIYSCQDLILKGNTFAYIKAGDVYCINVEKEENIFIYSPFQSGVMLLNTQTLIEKVHNQINFYEIGTKEVLCEIIPFHSEGQNFIANSSTVKLVNAGSVHLYYNEKYCGKIECENAKPIFEIISKCGKEYGLIKFDKSKHIILFDQSEILLCSKYIDYEISNNYIQIYEHNPNIFNIGKLIKYNFSNGEYITKSVNDRNCIVAEKSKDFGLEFFMEAIKCGRYKNAYEKLSYELRADISTDVLKQYFKQFDDYKYIDKTNAYITFKNYKVVGVYRFEVNQNLISNIY